MTRRASPRLLAYTAFASVALVAGLALGRVDLVVYGCPFVVFLLVGLALGDQPSVDLDVAVMPERSVEGEPIEIVATLRSATGAARVDVAAVLPAAVRALDRSGVHVARLEPGDEIELRTEVVSDRWGAHALGGFALRVHDRTSLFMFDASTAAVTTARFYPLPERLTRLARPRRTQLVAGDRMAKRSIAEGIELADHRPFVPGDRPRDVNWRVSARRNDLWVTQRHPERSTDVVIFVDMFSDAMLLPAVRAGATLLHGYLGSHDRVGLVGFGGVLQWVRGGQGVRQLYRLLDTLVDARSFFSYAWKDVSVIPPHVLAPGTMVVAVSPLEDPRSTSTLVDLRARGYEVAIIELIGDGDDLHASTDVDEAALRLWALQRAHQRDLFRQFGISVAQWRVGEPLGPSMEALWNASETAGARRQGSVPSSQ